MSNVLLSPDLFVSEERARELEQPLTDEQFTWLERHGRLDNGKTYEENRREVGPHPDSKRQASTIHRDIDRITARDLKRARKGIQ